jgi:hypothetical protein
MTLARLNPFTLFLRFRESRRERLSLRRAEVLKEIAAQAIAKAAYERGRQSVLASR